MLGLVPNLFYIFIFIKRKGVIQLKRLLEFISIILIIVAAVWFSWDYLIEYIPVIKDWVSGLFNSLSGTLLSIFPLLLILFIIFSILNN